MPALHQIISSLLALTIFANASRTVSQIATAGQQDAQSYGLRVSVDEVVLTFHAADAHHLPVNDLKLDELSLFDNGRPPRKILAFQSLQDLPLRAGILIDTSDSMAQDLASNESIATKYTQRLLRRSTDQAFIIKFSALSEVTQPWTSDTSALTEGIRRFAATRASHIRGTAIFNAIYQACLNQFGHINHPGTGNFILLFSDGEDNASNASLKNVVDACQHANTAIYAFRADPKSSFSTGPKTLTDLASQTGGCVFHTDDSEATISADLKTIEADLRNQYRLIYKPAELTPNGSFHRVELKAPERVYSLTVRSGYYAPVR
ncbi:MAG TPA: VWA domain-containing protein [Edaphobacter sp.]|nr:VWA domain-containing protein [Edaphobacter sp.]